ncbi:MAG: hypothetical protein K2K04_05205 [Clostridia bacterium]|nr:hypothetical protein [Clostridia bacterium]
MEHIGIKGNSIFRTFITLFFGVTLFFTFFFWVYVNDDLNAALMVRYGVEVQAEITNVGYVDNTDDDSSHHSYWQTYYKYVDEAGNKYTGKAYSFDSKSQAEEYIGKTIRVTINPINGKSSTYSLKHFKKESEGYRTHFICACVFSSLLVVSSVLFFYRVVFRSLRNKKIVNNLKSRYVDRGTIYGEVTKTFGLIWFYVKVKFTDEFGIAHEKWAGDWFTRREAEFLKEKKYISIVPYKRTYGISEQMPTAKKSKKSKNNE